MGFKRQEDHWAYQYKNAAPGTLENWIYIAACSIDNEQHARAVAQYCFDNNSSIWHASHIVGECRGLCICNAPACVKARGGVYSQL